ncbi:CHK domain-containing protein [Aphelenchoides bicaudatus]|nr:CHK domain-containing protein [Aphelenchoides bicaudatus]
MDDNVMQVENPHLRFELSGLLSHGDLWGNNIFFERNADGTCGNKVATILDFQCCYPGSGLDDLARFICTSASLEVLKEHEEHLLRLYFERINDELKSKGLPDRFPAYEKMLEVYKFHRMHEFLFSIFILLPISEQQTSAVERETTLGRLRHTFKQILIDMEQNK